MNFKKNSRKSSRYTSDRSHEILLPSTIFCDRNLSFLESIVVYLREEHKLGFSEIASLLNRNRKTIWTIYQRSIAKRTTRPAKVKIVSNIFIPLSTVRDRRLSILEIVIKYLVQKTSLTNHQIAVLLNRSDKTIWTVKDRANKKWTK